MFLKIYVNLSIYLKGGANVKKLEMVRCFISVFTSFLKFSCISETTFWNKKINGINKKYRDAIQSRLLRKAVKKEMFNFNQFPHGPFAILVSPLGSVVYEYGAKK